MYGNRQVLERGSERRHKARRKSCGLFGRDIQVTISFSFVGLLATEDSGSIINLVAVFASGDETYYEGAPPLLEFPASTSWRYSQNHGRGIE